MPFLRFFSFLCLTTLLTQWTMAQPKKQLVLLGTYHFANPGLDVAKVKTDNVLSERRQAEIKAVVERLKAYKPDQLFIEYLPTEQAHIDSLYQQYRQGKLRNRTDEVIQLAFRLADALNLPPGQIHCVDSPGDFPYDSLVQVAQTTGQQAVLAQLQTRMEAFSRWFDGYLPTHTVSDMLNAMNKPQFQQVDLNTYSGILNQIGTSENAVGSYIAGEWWKRNLRIQSNILRVMAGEKARKGLVIFGAGHVSVLNQLFTLDPHYDLIPVAKVLH
ncbi:DUF5694 domain-containing protein [Spirosoma spitsbergense]|uniref:DUF5694 domain-containing protein n=1 Tax=Spirosoma spitsbergense TaxID=431554 RepID=UPI001FE0DA85|nr:DUF5694 domain-containing protein [Spirosoma spitsbergense]